MLGGVGVAAFIAAPNALVTFSALVLWGVGVSLAFPLAISAGVTGADRASVRVSGISTIGYLAFLAGPPLIGLLSREFGILLSLAPLCVALLAAVGLAGLVAEGSDGPPAAPTDDDGRRQRNATPLDASRRPSITGGGVEDR